MSLNVNGSYSRVYAAYSATKTTASGKAKYTGQAKDAAAEAAARKGDEFVKTPPQQPVTYKPDMDKVSAMKGELKGNMAAFRAMVQGLFNTQGNYAMNAVDGLRDLIQNLEVDGAARAAAQEAVSEDGEWGVEATANRILEFAKAISGGDPSKIETLRKAVSDGFKAAEQVWGGKLPDISQKTYDRVMQGFDDWTAEANGEKEPAAAEAE